MEYIKAKEKWQAVKDLRELSVFEYEEILNSFSEHIAKLESDVCPACFGDCERLYSDGLMHTCNLCRGSGKRPAPTL